MNIPIEVVRQGNEVIDKYMELTKRNDELYGENSKSLKTFFDQIANIQQSIKSLENQHLYRTNAYFSEEDNEWKLPNIEVMSRFVDEIWTFQKNLETSLNDFAVHTYESVKVQEELNKIY